MSVIRRKAFYEQTDWLEADHPDCSKRFYISFVVSMATKPVAWQEQGPVSSLDGWVNESWAQGEVGATMSRNSPLQDKKAPRAEPEEDIDVLEPGAQDRAPQEDQTRSRPELADATKLENQESATPRETQVDVTELEVPKKLPEALQVLEDSEKPSFPPPPPPLSVLSTEDCFEKEGFSSPEGEAAEWTSDAEIISDPAEDLISLDKEWAQVTQLTELVDQEIDSTSDEVTEDDMAAEENDSQLHFLPDGFDNYELENNILR
ncbi:uncharacterized protein LOC121180109 [Toxotes jaculatrix]|uniref:uncharacterized protein LOC121180109 n=1 Tax=Toxotes jaculatrix TaxID=941984 RepID=UPI001B3A9693|nr:uncharacterized protein LOC121180109 [Toxotes jaculatrix]